ncbi:MAG TPA: asparagine synthase (glutamine-hydrolyzing), partial [Syntrophorhabdaceae bacterium]|nr:asparagine synthase (glutamine-hydrolyzing) [Syntrophorhabdaceae bacterium]
MCGICGFAAFDRDYRVDQTLIREMGYAIRHRGPDDEGYYFGEGIGLAHRRLSIIDLSTGKQPIYNEDKSKCIVFNGEIYNYQDLRQYLAGLGHTFQTKTDTEVILHLFEEKGEACVEDLRGMFAFAIWDNRERSLFLARDRLGIKPLYYWRSEQGVCFSSELKSILVFNKPNRFAVNYPLIDQYLALNYTMGPETMIQGIEKLMPGHTLTQKDSRVTVRQYWDFDGIKERGDSFDECLEKTRALLEETTRIHLISDVPLGAFLSGGIDSSLTVAIMAQLTNRPV